MSRDVYNITRREVNSEVNTYSLFNLLKLPAMLVSERNAAHTINSQLSGLFRLLEKIFNRKFSFSSL